jgi:23S rRNA (adenine2503-C2)-methyltransferase
MDIVMKNPDLTNSILGLSEKALTAYVVERGYPPFHARQIFTWLYERQVESFDRMTDIPKALREQLKRDYTLDYYHASHILESKRGDTVKYFFPVEQGVGIESVVLKDDENRTSFCISSQIGCPVGCMYCATGHAGFIRNLAAGEILTQVLTLMKRHESPDSILFMGMGEPLLNLAEVKEALRHFRVMGMSSRRITVSTCGLIRGMYDLADSGLRPRLALSLGSALERKRKKMIPFARSSSILELQRALVGYREKTRRRVTIEYTLVRNLNDTLEDEEALVRFARATKAHVNLIKYNPFPSRTRSQSGGAGDIRLASPRPEIMRRFRETLIDRGIEVTERFRRGADIDAACGQLLYYRK